MKRVLLLLLCAIFAVNTVCAKDIIVLFDTTEIEAMIVDVGQKVITYKDWSNQDGPILTIEKSKVFYIQKENGNKDYLTNPTIVLSPTVKTSRDKYKKDKPIQFEGYTYGGVIIYHSDAYGLGAGPMVDVSLGVDIYKRFYIGAMLGIYTMFASAHTEEYKAKSNEIIIPIAPINLKFHLVKNEIMNPFIDFAIGLFVMHSRVSIDTYSINQTNHGLFLQAGAGYNADGFSFSIGYTGLMINQFAHIGHIKFGANF